MDAKSENYILKMLSDSGYGKFVSHEVLESLFEDSFLITQNYDVGDIILDQNQINDYLYILMEGSVEIISNGEVVVRLGRAGDVFGEVSVITGNPTSALIRASSKCSVLVAKIKGNVPAAKSLGRSRHENIQHFFSAVLVDKLSRTTKTAEKFESTNKNLQQTNDAYSKFLPDQFIKLLGKNSINELKLGDHIEREITILFSDIRGFTKMSEQFGTEETFNVLNEYLGIMASIVTKHNGFVDKFIGDAIMAIFETPDSALTCAVDMVKTLHSDKRLKGMSIGIGINSGQAMIGILGAENRMESTVISDAVNLASRCEGLTKTYGVSILFTENTFFNIQHPKTDAMRVIDKVLPKGKSEPTTVYEIFEGEPLQMKIGKVRSKRVFEKAIVDFHMGNYESAKEKFEECITLCPDDRAAKTYLNRCIKNTPQ